ncbi:mfs transporter, sp family, general alpha glucoside:h+ symporter [Trichoderma arundinaceum]|uniref:Mfs transporter, sp family, general alpha glucoside:h+ symporter n=1 Tax=Trichoderma arundinaceum TaxID=490622 RepID=A0A395NG17_TRIAR|nr:mfs transporter, sp family, general alpha glucoside:h+ symporter [Trichoderma arundinaceum]
MATKHTKSSHEEFVDQNNALHKQQRWWNWRVLMNLLIVGFALGLFGYDNAFASPLLFAPNLGALVVGRFWNYFGISILTNIAPIYLSELVPASVRARAVGFAIAGSGAVSVVATVVVWASAKILDKRQYIIPLAIQAAIPVLLLVLSFFLTESPIWLLSQGRTDAAKRSLNSLRGNNSALVELELTTATIALQSKNEKKTAFKWWEILKIGNLERTLSSAALLCLSQVGGQILVGTYSTVLLVQSGVSDPFKITIIIFLMQFAGTLLGPFLLDKFGRRTVALPGYIILFVLDLAAGSIACVGLTNKAKQLGLASLCIIFSFVNSISFQSM